MARLKLAIRQFGNVLVGRVLEQGAHLASDLFSSDLSVASQGFEVHAAPEPSLHNRQLNLSTKEPRHDKWFSHAYDSETAALSRLAAIRTCVRNINEQPGQWDAQADGFEIIE